MIKRESGATLLVVLVMLVVITLLGIAGIKMSTSSLLVVGNMQARKFTENWAQQAVEQVMSTITPFNSPTAAVTITGLPSGLTATVTNRVCMYSAPASGYSAVSTIAPEDNIWDYEVTMVDSFTGARSHIVQGAKIRQLSGYCL
jgi:Tfp pilus assembly protein PilX